MRKDDSRCGTFGRIVASDATNQRFESSHPQFLFTVDCIENKKERPNLKI